MAAASNGNLCVQGWRKVYLAALFEIERSQLHIRSAEAECALLERERELFSSTDSRQEQNALLAARNALRALRICYGLE